MPSLALLSRTDPVTARVRPDPSPSTIAVVICAYTSSRWNDLVQAVKSVTQQSHPAEELVVVIDHNDELLERARQALPEARVLASTGRPGLCGARNTGLAAVRSELVAFLDDDASADPDWLEQLAAGLRDEGVIGVGGWVQPSWETAPPRWLAPELYWIVGCSYIGLPGVGGAIRNGIGANMAFRREVLVRAEGFREDIGQRADQPLRNDDTDLGIRVRACCPGGEIVHLPAARVEHRVPDARSSWRYLFMRCWSEGRGKAILARSHGSSAALTSEYGYISSVLPAGVARGLIDRLRGDPSGLGRSASIVVALTVTTAGYVFGRLSRRDG